MQHTRLSSLHRRIARAALVLGTAVAGQVVLLPSVSASVTTLTVTTTADIGAEDGACGNSQATTAPATLSLREATCLANNIGADTTINVPAGTYVLTGGELRLGGAPGQVTRVVGAGRASTVIDAGGLSRVLELDFNLTGGVATSISGVTITGGVDDTFGGAGIIAGSGNSDMLDSLTISDSTISGNHANPSGSGTTDRPGGGVQFIGGSLTLDHTTVSDNSSGNSPGSGIFYQGQGIVAGESLTIDGSTFSGNSAVAGVAGVVNGGALAVSAGSYTVSATRFVDNTVTGSGTGAARGAAIWSQGGALTVRGSTFTGNSVTGGIASGGAVAVDGGSAALHYNRITGNTSSNGSGAYRGSGATLDATDNWWGCNTGPGTGGCDTVAGSPTVSPRLMLTAAANPATVVAPNATSTITAAFTQNSLGSAINAADLGAFAGLPVTWSDPLPSGATLSPASSVLSAGSASTSYNSQNTSGPGHVLATLDNGGASATVTVNRAPAVTSSPSNQAVTAGASVTFAASASGFPTPTVQWQRSIGGGSFTDVAGATGTSYTFAAAAGDNGASYRAVFTNVAGTAASAAALLTVQSAQPPVVTSADHASFTVGSVASFTVTSSPAATTLTATGALPSGVAFTDNGNGNATLAGVASTGTGGTYGLSFKATNSTGYTTQAFTLTVNESPTITSADHATFQAGAAGSFLVTTSAGFPVATALSTTGSLPSGLTFTPNGSGGAAFAGTPAAGTAGSYPITITASNGASTPATQSFTLTVIESPVISSADHASFSVGSPGWFTVTTAGGAGRVAISEAGALPSGVGLTDNGDGTATLAGTPAAGAGGSYSITLTASDGITPDTRQLFTLTVNEPPALTSADHVTFVAGSAGGFTVTTLAGYPASTTITETGALPSGVSFTDNGDGTARLAGTAAAGTAGRYPLTITATNAGGSSQQSYALTVQPANSSPAISSADKAIFTKGSASSFTVTTTAGYPTATTITKTGTLPTGVTFTDNYDGTATIAGTPTVAGSFPITITASNGATTDAQQSFTLMSSTPPVITSANKASFSKGFAGQSFRVTTLAGYPTATILTETGALPTGMTFTDNHDGTATIAGTPSVAGTFPLVIKASNGVSQDASQAFTLTVNTPVVR